MRSRRVKRVRRVVIMSEAKEDRSGMVPFAALRVTLALLNTGADVTEVSQRLGRSSRDAR
jgi:hypothetical protein